MSDYKRLTNNNLEEYDPEYDFCMGCKYFGEPNGCNRPNGTCANYERFIETYNRLAELEDKIEQGELVSKEWHDEQVLHAESIIKEYQAKIENGTLIELPCKVGDTVYIACKWDIDKVVKGTVSEIEYIVNTKGYYHRIYVDHPYIRSITNPHVVQNRYIFFTNEVFLTKPEAEAKLKELMGEKYGWD